MHDKINQLMAMGEFNLAHKMLVDVLSREPKHTGAWLQLAELNLKLGNLHKVSQIIARCKAFCVTSEDVLRLAKLSFDCGERDCTRDLLTQLDLTSNATHHDFAANLWLRLNHPHKALSLFQSAYTLSPHSPQIALNYATCLKMSGDIAAAKTILSTLINNNPSPKAFLSLSELSSGDEAKRLLQQIQRLLETDPNDQYLNHAAALCSESFGEYRSAWRYFLKSKETAYTQSGFKSEKHTEFCHHRGSQTLNLTLPVFDKVKPIFVVGMPRSGTSLVEQLIATQPNCNALGELSDMPSILAIKNGFYGNHELSLHPLSKSLIEQYASLLNASLTDDVNLPVRGVDKQPFNIYFVDVILALFPNAKIVWVVRNKFDTCVGNFRQAYQAASPFHQYSYSWQHIEQYYDDIELLGQHWLHRFPKNMMLLRYDELVNDPEPVLAQLFSFLNISTQGSPLSFYKDNYFSATASKLQLRQPLNNQSIGRFKGIYPVK